MARKRGYNVESNGIASDVTAANAQNGTAANAQNGTAANAQNGTRIEPGLASSEKQNGHSRTNYERHRDIINHEDQHALTQTVDETINVDEEAKDTEELFSDTEEGGLILDDVSYTVHVWPARWYRCGCARKKVEKQVLKNISAVLKRGQLTAVLGNSGSGKSSLLDVIASRVDDDVVGRISLHQQPLTVDAFRQHAGYVIQADRLLPNLTVEETLLYTAQLKFMEQCSKQDIQNKVNSAIEDMGLRHVRNSRIGGLVMKGISGGEKRRVSVAIQLLQDPELLLLDEPTTGLDSFTARNLVSSLAQLAQRRKKIVILSIHQPRSELFPMFNQVALLSQGEMVYCGPQQQMINYFTSLGHPCPTYVNPLDHYIDLVSVDHRDAENERKTSAKVICLQNQYKKDALYISMREEIDKGRDRWEEKQKEEEERQKQERKKKRCHCDIKKTLTATWILLRRMMVNLMRDGGDLGARVGSLTAYAFLLWIFLFNLKNDLSSLQDRAGIFYQSTSATPMIGLLNVIALFPSLRDVYYREAGDGLYGSSSFLIAYFIHIIPFTVISSLIYSTWAYWGLGMYPDPGRFGIYFVVMVLCQMFGELQTVLVMGIVDGPALASGISTLIISISVLSATGLIRATASMPDVVQWIAYGTWMKYAVEIIAANEFDGLVIECPDNAAPLPCDGVAEAWLDYFFPDSIENMGRNFAIIFAYLGGVYILILLLYKIKKIKHLN